MATTKTHGKKATVEAWALARLREAGPQEVSAMVLAGCPCDHGTLRAVLGALVGAGTVRREGARGSTSRRGQGASADNPRHVTLTYRTSVYSLV